MGRRSGETDVGGSGQDLSNVWFGAGSWRHVYHYDYYSSVPNDRYDPRKESQYRKVVVNDAKVFALDTWLLGLLLAALPGAVLARKFRRYMARRRAARGDLCRTCGYDLRATPERCPECGSARAGAELRRSSDPPVGAARCGFLSSATAP